WREEWARGPLLGARFAVTPPDSARPPRLLGPLAPAPPSRGARAALKLGFVGCAPRHADTVALAKRLELGSLVRFMPYQSRGVLSESLSSAHIHFVGLAKGLAGFIVPSRLYGILSAGRPVIVGADPDSETARL